MTSGLRWACVAGVMAWLVNTVGDPALEAQKFTWYAPVSLEAVIESYDSSGNACGVCPDGGGAYVDGVDGVSAGFDKWGNLIIDFRTTRQPFRSLTYELSNPFGGALDRGSVTSDDNYLSTLHAPQKPIQLMDPGEEQCAGAVITYTGPDIRDTRVYFQRPLADIDMSTTSHLVVRRVDDNVWTAETRASESGCDNSGTVAGVGRLIEVKSKGGIEYTDRGLYFIPLKVTLTRRQ